MNFYKNNEKNTNTNDIKTDKPTTKISNNNLNDEKKKNKKILNKIFNLNKKILDIEKKIKEAPLRFLATIENIKKEKKKEIKLIKKNYIKEFFKKFIIILQNINKITLQFNKFKNLNNAEFQGISLIQKSIIEIIKKNKIQKIGKVGEKYNQNLHKIKNKKNIKIHKNYIIKKVKRIGYILNKEILKKAIVKI
ncbi:Protein GrpE [Buchnera aphidicola (Chaitophorus populicola)]|uniref:nucleotide exchange factor GrpE n=1 Tax=Buchnera aphidicola TaxID=9 RepID=UPI003463E5C9